MRTIPAQPHLTEELPPLMRWAYHGLKRLCRPLTSFVVLDRDELPHLLNRLALTNRGVEVGVQRGLYSEVLLSRWKGRQLVSVDPWQQDDYDDPASVSQFLHDRNHRECCDRLSRFEGRSTIWRMTGDEAARQIPNESLSFVYLDARHDYDSVLHDLRVWWPKLALNGLMAGHDYLNAIVEYDLEQTGQFEVKRAVDEFFPTRPVLTTLADRPWRTWYVRKPSLNELRVD